MGDETVMNPHADEPCPATGTKTPSQLSIAVIGPDDLLRGSLLDAINQSRPARLSEFSSYPPKLHDMSNLLVEKYDVVMIEIDSDPEYAVNIMRVACTAGNSTVMVYSKMSDVDLPDPDLLTRCTRIGAREFLSLPFAGTELTEALERADVAHLGRPQPKKAKGRLLVFCGAKGGAGVTNITCNFAVTLAKLSGEKTLLIDMDLPLGDVALNLGVEPRYSTIDALQNHARVDSSFLDKLVMRHGSGLCVLLAPGRFPFHPTPNDAFDRLLRVARQEFENVVVDAGSKLDLANSCAEYLESTTLYLVTQSGIPELRNANRLIAQCRSLAGPRLEVVLNRHPASGSRITEDEITRALTCPISWKIPNDYKAVRAMQDTSALVMATGSSISCQIDAMVRAACGLPSAPPQRKGFSFRRWFVSSAKHTRRPTPPSELQQFDPIEHAEESTSQPSEVLRCPVLVESTQGGPFIGINPRRESLWNC